MSKLSPLPILRGNVKKARKWTPGAYLKFFFYSVLAAKTRGQVGRGEKPLSLQLCLGSIFPAIPLCFYTFKSGKVFGLTVQTFPLISAMRPK